MIVEVSHNFFGVENEYREMEKIKGEDMNEIILKCVDFFPAKCYKIFFSAASLHVGTPATCALQLCSARSAWLHGTWRYLLQKFVHPIAAGFKLSTVSQCGSSEIEGSTLPSPPLPPKHHSLKGRASLTGIIHQQDVVR